MNPTPGDVHVNAVLTNVSIGWATSQDMFIADQVFPNVPVQKQSDRYYVYQREDWYRDDARVRAPSSESAGGGFRLDNTPTYFAPVYALHKDVDDQTRSNSDSVLNLDRDATLYVTQQLMLRREKQWMASYFKAGVWTADLTGVAGTPSTNQFKQWSAAGSTPIEDIRARIVAMAQLTGYKPNTLVLGAQTWSILIDHPEILDRIKYNGAVPAQVTEQDLANLLKLDKVLVSWAVENTAAEGIYPGTFSFVAGKGALLAYSAPAPSLMVPSAGYTFSWVGYLGAGNQGNRIKQFRVETLASDRVEGEIAFDTKLVAADLGAFFATAVA